MNTGIEKSHKSPINSFRDLNVFQNSFNAALAIHEISKRFPSEEKYSLTDQIRRASRSVPANIAEAWRKRRYAGAFISKLSDAEGEAAETQVWIDMAYNLTFISKEQWDDFNNRYETILGQLVKMIREPRKWCLPDNKQ
ncbi:MAG: four helix bundle protein [bacterium]